MADWLCRLLGHRWRMTRYCVWQFATERRCSRCGRYEWLPFSEAIKAEGERWHEGRFDG